MGKLTRGVLFHQDNAPTHMSTVAVADIQKCGFQLIEDPSYSPDLAPSDQFLFPKNARLDDVMNAMGHFLRYQNGAFYTEGIHLFHDRWTKCVNVGGDYVEK